MYHNFLLPLFENNEGFFFFNFKMFIKKFTYGKIHSVVHSSLGFAKGIALCNCYHSQYKKHSASPPPPNPLLCPTAVSPSPRARPPLVGSPFALSGVSQT